MCTSPWVSTEDSKSRQARSSSIAAAGLVRLLLLLPRCKACPNVEPLHHVTACWLCLVCC